MRAARQSLVCSFLIVAHRHRLGLIIQSPRATQVLPLRQGRPVWEALARGRIQQEHRPGPRLRIQERLEHRCCPDLAPLDSIGSGESLNYACSKPQVPGSSPGGVQAETPDPSTRVGGERCCIWRENRCPCHERAPTGGYLLQAVFSTAHRAGRSIAGPSSSDHEA